MKRKPSRNCNAITKDGVAEYLPKLNQSQLYKIDNLHMLIYELETKTGGKVKAITLTNKDYIELRRNDRHSMYLFQDLAERQNTYLMGYKVLITNEVESFSLVMG